jgi:hypothetical protein
MKTMRQTARIILNSFSDPLFDRIFPTEEMKIAFIEKAISEHSSVPLADPKVVVPSKAVLESFFEPQKMVVSMSCQQAIPKELPPLPNDVLGSLLNTAHTLIEGERHSIARMSQACKIDFRLIWTGENSSETTIEIVDLKIGPASKIGKYARILAKYVDWNCSELVNSASNSVLKSQEFKNFRSRIKTFMREVGRLKTLYQFDFEKDIIEALQKPCTVVPEAPVVKKAPDFSVDELVKQYDEALYGEKRNP